MLSGHPQKVCLLVGARQWLLLDVLGLVEAFACIIVFLAEQRSIQLLQPFILQHERIGKVLVLDGLLAGESVR